jgi:hypothetical protein
MVVNGQWSGTGNKLAFQGWTASATALAGGSRAGQQKCIALLKSSGRPTLASCRSLAIDH